MVPSGGFVEAQCGFRGATVKRPCGLAVVPGASAGGRQIVAQVSPFDELPPSSQDYGGHGRAPSLSRSNLQLSLRSRLEACATFADRHRQPTEAPPDASGPKANFPLLPSVGRARIFPNAARGPQPKVGRQVPLPAGGHRDVPAHQVRGSPGNRRRRVRNGSIFHTLLAGGATECLENYYVVEGRRDFRVYDKTRRRRVNRCGSPAGGGFCFSPHELEMGGE